MKCANHPNKEGTDICSVCGKIICDDCKINIGNTNYCQECASELINAGVASKVKKQMQNGVVTQEPIPQENENLKDLFRENNMYEELNGQNTNIPPEKTPKDIEEKYEKYLDDIYSEDDEINSMNNNTNNNTNTNRNNDINNNINNDINSYEYQNVSNDLNNQQRHNNQNNRKIFKNRNSSPPKNHFKKFNDKNNAHRTISLHKKSKKQESNKTNTITYVLVLILIILIVFVGTYVIYLVFLKSTYPGYFDALIALFTNPGSLFQG
ncbi:MAG: hypothetical protein LBM96_12555 [Methanobrevibacter sp.]|jgi:predicted RND superfamily exporter protein|nr:hypothetical protein [Candidatus Methanoflexus mossambicus]